MPGGGRKVDHPPGAKQPNKTGEVCFCDTGEVYKVELYRRVRRAVQVDGMSVREAEREFGL